MKEEKWYVRAFKSRPIQYSVFGAIIIGLIYLFGRQAGRNSFADYKPKTLPEDPNWAPDIYVEQGWSVLNGYFTLASDKEEFFITLYGLSDRQLTSIYNLYGSRYGKKDGYSLTKKIDAEWNVFWTSRRGDLVKKLRNLGLN